MNLNTVLCVQVDQHTYQTSVADCAVRMKQMLFLENTDFSTLTLWSCWQLLWST